jgi:hypothetical protein
MLPVTSVTFDLTNRKMSQQTAKYTQSKKIAEQLETAQAEAAVAFGLLYRAMSVIEDLTTLRPPAMRLQIEIEKLNEELIDINGVHE